MKKVFALVALFVAATIPVPATAQTANLQISPLKTVVTAEPGETVEVPILLRNTSNKPLTAQVSAKDFTAGPELNGEPKLLETTDQTYGLSNWFLDANIQKNLTIPAKQTITYQARFLVPGAAQERSYFGSVIFTYGADDGQLTSVGNLVFVTIGNPSVRLSIDEIRLNESENAADSHGVITATVTNGGDGLADPKFRLRITGDGGKLLEEIVSDAAGSVLPRSSRKYSFALTKPLPDEHITFTLSATDQHGTTTDKALQLDLRSDSAAAAPQQADETAADGRLLLPLLIALLVALFGISGWALYRRRKIRARQTLEHPDTPTTSDTPAHDTDKNSSNQ